MELTEAKRIAAQLVQPGGSERVWLERAVGRVLAEDLYADRDIPREARAAVDGFALASSDTVAATAATPRFLKLQGQTLAAGETADRKMAAGECLRILTGAPVPSTADAVVPQEETTQTGGDVLIRRCISAGEGMVSPGSDIRQGNLLLAKGIILTPTRLALIAACGHSTVAVYRQPQIALLATGNEVREMGECLQGPHTFCNNRYLLAWSAELQGGRPIHLGIAADDPLLIAARLEAVEADLIITTGGVGQGDRDFILAAWKMLGVEPLFVELNLLPGRRTALGKEGKRIFVGLPGSPWGAQVAFEQLVAPMLRKQQGLGASHSPSVAAVLETTIRKRKGFSKVVRGAVQQGSSGLMFMPVDRGKSHLFATLPSSLAYILLESHVSESSAGSEVQVRFHDLPLLAFPLFGVESAREGYYA